MRLEGYRCDQCGVESRDKTGDWYQLQVARVQHGGMARIGGWEAHFSDGTHFCSRACLIASSEGWKTR